MGKNTGEEGVFQDEHRDFFVDLVSFNSHIQEDDERIGDSSLAALVASSRKQTPKTEVPGLALSAPNHRHYSRRHITFVDA